MVDLIDNLLPLRVTAVADVAEGIRSFELRDPNGAELPAFEAGAHIRVTVTLPDGSAALRHYSLLGDPQDRTCYRIAVLLEREGRGGSRYLHEQTRVGELLLATMPVNGFPLVTEATHSILIAGGIGITPILAMLRTLAHREQSHELHFAARTPSRMAFRHEVEAIASTRARFYFGPHFPELESILADSRPGRHVYVCGPVGLLRAVTSVAHSAGWPSNRIHSESFGPRQEAGDHAIEVHLARSALTVNVAPGETILDALLAAGVWAPYECRHGSCGSCMTRFIEGEPDHRDSCLTEPMREEYLCPCVSRAHSTHLTLDL